MIDAKDLFIRPDSDPNTLLQLGLIFAFVLVVSLGGSYLKGLAKRKKRANYSNSHRKLYVPKPVADDARETDIADPANQMRFVAKVGFIRQPLLNREEQPLLSLLEKTVRELDQGYRVMAQTSLGEVLKPKPGTGSARDRHMAFKSINSKRLDFAIFDTAGRLMAAVEYQGSGHYHETSFMRDAVKREALRKAGVTMIEVPNAYSPAVVEQQIVAVLQGTRSEP
ncbi:DUF2726 domain-containing protein [Neptunicoccus cionae]|uniref:DUF2726 domain-containing protein n=1 Tax=Neptunicoccus cionae TaxID=2035344 RepID=UPI000C78B430|nr:DUF2726 domain-containing protein [Amylibacter cionae]PLS22348.1 hypothetical protein C0U40_07965 [Amylibacter cionae]